MEVVKHFIGGGIIFPMVIEKGRVPIHSDKYLLRASILHILNWPKNHRYFNEQFGCRIEECLEEPLDNITKSLLELFIKESINKWEKRIVIKQIEFKEDIDRATLYVRLVYNIRNTKLEDTYIFPFYRNIKY